MSNDSKKTKTKKEKLPREICTDSKKVRQYLDQSWPKYESVD
jgi:hypothetical protein